LIFGFLVLPALAARPLVSRMSKFLLLSSLLGLVMAFMGFYSSVRLDLPLGPTDVTLGCCLIFLAYGLRRISAKASATVMMLLFVVLLIAGCAPSMTVTTPVPDAKAVRSDRIWLAKVKNSTGLPLLLPSTNLLRSAGEMFGKVPSDYRQNVMDLLRDGLHKPGYGVAFPGEPAARFPPFPAETNAAVQLGREGKLSGLVLVSEIWRWEGYPQQFVRVFVDFKLVRLEDGAVLWDRRVQRAIPTPSSTNLGQAYTDAVIAVVHEIFG